jgi:hypothetical protein
MTIEEIKTAVEKQPELKTAIVSSFKPDFVAGAEAEGLVVRTKAQDQQYLDNHVNAVVDDRVKKEVQKKIDEEYGNTMRGIDEQIKSVTGIERKPGEKTTDYAKRAIEEKRQGGDPVTKEKVTQLEQLLASTKTDYETKLQEAQTQLFNKEIEWQVNSDLDKRSYALPVHLKTEEEKQAYINQQKAFMRQDLMGTYTRKKDEQGNIIWYEGDKPLMNQKDGKPKGAGDIIGEKYNPWFVPAGKVVTGTGGGSTGLPDGGFKKKEEIHAYLAANGMEAGSKAYMDKFESLATEAKIDI